MKESFYLIDEIARKVGVTKRTLRYYEEQGLLSPATRTEKGYRLYSEEDAARLERIIELRDVMGFSLNDIKEIIEEENQIARLREAYRRGETAQDRTGLLNNLKCSTTNLLNIVKEKKAKIEAIETFYMEKLNRIEKHLRELE